MTTQPTPPIAHRTLYAPGTPPIAEVPSPWPDADISFRGWGSINGRKKWPDLMRERETMMREMLAGLAKTRRVEPPTQTVVIGCEHRSRWLAEDKTRQPDIDNLLHLIVHAMRAVHGRAVEVAFSGAEDRIAGDFRTPMIGAGTQWDTAWKDAPPLPFISPIYGASAEHVGQLLARMTLAAGLRRGVVLWVQQPAKWTGTPAEHRAETFIWARAVCGHAAAHQAAMIAEMPAETEGAD
jgi:hypothetical protein